MNQSGQFDRDIWDQLVAQINNGTETLTPNEFADVWVEAEKRILKKIGLNTDIQRQLKVLAVNKGKGQSHGSRDKQPRSKGIDPQEDAGLQGDRLGRLSRPRAQRVQFPVIYGAERANYFRTVRGREIHDVRDASQVN